MTSFLLGPSAAGSKKTSRVEQKKGVREEERWVGFTLIFPQFAESRWNQLEPDGSRWTWVEPAETRWISTGGHQKSPAGHLLCKRSQLVLNTSPDVEALMANGKLSFDQLMLALAALMRQEPLEQCESDAGTSCPPTWNRKRVVSERRQAAGCQGAGLGLSHLHSGAAVLTS